MKQKRTMTRQKAVGKDYGKDLYHTIIFLLGLLVILWYLKV
jgi:hypothetical protein